jgi:hypothetical protein
VQGANENLLEITGYVDTVNDQTTYLAIPDHLAVHGSHCCHGNMEEMLNVNFVVHIIIVPHKDALNHDPLTSTPNTQMVSESLDATSKFVYPSIALKEGNNHPDEAKALSHGKRGKRKKSKNRLEGRRKKFNGTKKRKGEEQKTES